MRYVEACSEVWMDLLRNSNEDMTLEQVLGYAKAKEARKGLASHLLLPQATDEVAGSTYWHPLRPQQRTTNCTYCGTKRHG